jgi:hypothetical protein
MWASIRDSGIWRVHLSFGRIGVFSTLIENSWQSKQLDNI